MGKDNFKQAMFETMLFNELKDCNIKNSDYLKKKYQGLDIDYSKIYRRIVNYQVRMYGSQLHGDIKRISEKDKEMMRGRKNEKNKTNENKKKKKVC